MEEVGKRLKEEMTGARGDYLHGYSSFKPQSSTRRQGRVGGRTAGGRDDWSPGGITSMVIPASNQKTREEVGKRPEDELTGAQGGLPP